MNRPAFSRYLTSARLWRYPTSNAWQKNEGWLPLPDTGADVWLCPLTPQPALTAYLSTEEKVRMQNFLPQEKAQEFARARGYLRILLASYAGLTEPGAIRIGVAEHGKPYALDFPELRFNLSHSFEWVAIAISRREVGIDIEKLRPVPDWRDLAQGLLRPDVTAEISALNPQEQSESFLEQFTAREAFLKMKSTGFAQAHGTSPTADSDSKAQPSGLSKLPAVSGYVGHICLAKSL